MRKATLAFATATVGAALALSACSSSGTADNSPSASASGTESAAPLSGELLIWDTGLLGKTLEGGAPDMDKSFLDRAAKDFMAENPGLTVKVVQQGGDISANSAQFQAASIAGNGPDIRIQYAGGPTLSFADFFADLNGVFDQETIDAMSGWNTVRKNYDANGELLGMPYGSGLYFLVFSNDKILKEAGIDPSVAPKTWEEMLANGEKVKAATGKNAFWAANLEGYVGAWAVGALLGGELGEQASTDMYLGKVPVNDPAMVKVYQAWQDLGKSGLTNPDAGSVSNGESTAGFVQGKGAYYLVGSWENGNMDKEFGNDVSWFYIPMLEGAKYPEAVAGGPSVAVSITNYAKNPEAAKAFLRYLAQPEVQDEYVRLNQTEGSNNKNADTSVITNRLLREQAEGLKTKTPVVFPFDSVMPQSVIDLFYRVNASTFLDKTTPQDAADQLQAANEKEIADR